MRLWTLFLTLLIGVLSYIGWILYKELEVQKTVLEYLQQQIKLSDQIAKEAAVEGTALATSELMQRRWCDIQPKTKDTVVQIFTHGAQFNWLEPYKTPNQFQATGSGFFINKQGDIITNAHVVNEAKALFIQIPSLGKRRFEVEVVGVSPERDLALVRLKEEEKEFLIQQLGEIKYLPIGNSDLIHRADEVMALGYPLGQQSLKSTTGVVSGREHMEGHSMIQISAPINPGSSGGPSLNCFGEVVGVNTAGVTQAQNVGYIIPGNEVKLFLRQLDYMPPQADSIKFLRKPFLGVIFNNATEQLTSFLGNPLPGGLYVVETYKGSPLHKAGVQPGDMIYEIDGHKVDLYGELSVPWSEDRISIIDYVSRLMIGDTIHLLVYRNGKPKKFSLKFDQSELAPVRIMYPAYEKVDYEVFGGMVIMPLAINHIPQLLQNAPELSRYMEFKNQMEPALLVTHVFPDSCAARTRTIGAGAIIREVNGEPVKNLQDFRAAVLKCKSSEFLTLKTYEKVFVVMNLEKILKEERKLAQNYFYRLSPLVEQLETKTT